MSEIPCLTYMALYILSFHILQSNSRTSTLWKLNAEDGKIIEASHFPKLVTLSSSAQQEEIEDDPIFNIITSTVIHYGKTWTKRSADSSDNLYCTNCENLNSTSRELSGSQNVTSPPNVTLSTKSSKKPSSSPDKKQSADKKSSPIPPSSDNEQLDCGKTVNFTYYDSLVGIANRMSHPNVPEPTVALIFKKRGAEFDVEALERRLMKAKREKPKSVQLYNQIGNFFRIKGDTYRSIECFRRALAVSPHNAEVLLNLARVLFNLQYLDDAIYLTRRSLEVQPPDKSAWMQYYTLGEIFKAYGHYQEAALHLRHCLELRPEFEPALALLRDMDTLPDNTIHIYTLLIIICLVLGVLLVIVSSVDANLETDFDQKSGNSASSSATSHRHHFNRAMAMRSLKMGGGSLRSSGAKRGAGGNGGG
ncbi:hypothetical protein LSTR_LSTR012679 [Laodelphax striatellus]|uniref:Uncharacterized protein n=1 Tax=Laodelphax striatellus TaxID=195883 RepID=A0A482XKC9_LAOST|nr:hypothetical protein LSTR_LSTR012679 [Laodelphax striatellus]